MISSSHRSEGTVEVVFGRENNKLVTDQGQTLASLARRAFAAHLSRGALSLRDHFFTFIVSACENEKWEILLKNKKDISVYIDAADKSVIMHFVMYRNVEIIQRIIRNNLFQNLIGKNPGHVLHAVVREGFQDLMDYFLKNGFAHARALDDKGANLLLNSIESGQKDLIYDCLHYGINPKQCFSYMGFRLDSLSLAVYKGSIECLDKLIESLNNLNRAFQIDFSCRIENVGTLLHLAIHADQPHILEHLLTKYYKFTKKLIEICDKENRTPFMLAAFYGKIEMLETLIYAKANLLAEDEKGCNAIHHAVKGKQSETIKFLHKRGLCVNTIGLRGRTPLIIAKKLYRMTRDIEYKKIKVLLENLSDFQKVNPQPILDYKNLPPDSFVFQSSMFTPPVIFQQMFEALEARNILKDLKRVGGVSHGALMAVIIAIGEKTRHIFFSISVLSTYFNELPLKKIRAVRKKLETLAMNPDKSPFSFLDSSKHYSRGIRLRDRLNELIKEYTEIANCTFGEFAELVFTKSKNVKTGKFFKHLHILVVDAKNRQVLQINSEEKKWKNFLIADVVVSGIAFPIFIKIQNLRKKKNQHISNSDLFCMGGWGFVDPAIQMFDQKKYIFNCFEDLEKDSYHFNNRVLSVRFDPTKDEKESKQFIDFTSGKPLVKKKYEDENSLKRKRIIKIKVKDLISSSDTLWEIKQINETLNHFFSTSLSQKEEIDGIQKNVYSDRICAHSDYGLLIPSPRLFPPPTRFACIATWSPFLEDLNKGGHQSAEEEEELEEDEIGMRKRLERASFSNSTLTQSASIPERSKTSPIPPRNLRHLASAQKRQEETVLSNSASSIKITQREPEPPSRSKTLNDLYSSTSSRFPKSYHEAKQEELKNTRGSVADLKKTLEEYARPSSRSPGPRPPVLVLPPARSKTLNDLPSTSSHFLKSNHEANQEELKNTRGSVADLKKTLEENARPSSRSPGPRPPVLVPPPKIYANQEVKHEEEELKDRMHHMKRRELNPDLSPSPPRAPQYSLPPLPQAPAMRSSSTAISPHYANENYQNYQ